MSSLYNKSVLAGLINPFSSLTYVFSIKFECCSITFGLEDPYCVGLIVGIKGGISCFFYYVLGCNFNKLFLL